MPVIAPRSAWVLTGRAFQHQRRLGRQSLGRGFEGRISFLFLTDQPGILDEEGQLISSVTSSGLKNMIDAKMVTGGMLTKTLAILHALQNGVARVRVMRGIEAADDVENGPFGTACSVDAPAMAKEEAVHAAL